MAYSLGSLTDLGQIQQEIINKKADLVPYQAIRQDSDQTQVLDFGGVVMEITIIGIKTGTPVELNSFCQLLRWLVDGQQNSILYVSDMLEAGGIRVKVKDLSFDYLSGKPNELSYNIVLIQSSTLGDM